MPSRALQLLGRAWAFLDRIGWIIALIFLAIGFIVVHAQGVSVDELRLSQLRGCHRLNVIRAEDNRSQLQDFRLFTSTAALIAAAAAHPTQPSTSRQRASTRAYLAQIDGDVLAKEWTELTKCRPATLHPLRYVAPTPIAFSKQLPPRRALYLGSGE